MAETERALDVEKDSIPELDSLPEKDEVIGHATVPGTASMDIPARTIGESLVRDSLLDIENRLTARNLPEDEAPEDESV